MLFLNNAFTKDITEYDGEVLKEVKTVDGKIYLSNGAIIKEGVVGKFFDIATNDKYGTVFEADGPDEIGPIVGFAPVTGVLVYKNSKSNQSHKNGKEKSGKAYCSAAVC